MAVTRPGEEVAVCLLVRRRGLFNSIYRMATLVANRPVDLNGPEAAARQHAQAVARNYLSQPRLSEYTHRRVRESIDSGL